jgi:nanoRNase/pAp phosphatase (c-di-AMP/oligoRNAs hydrolase)
MRIRESEFKDSIRRFDKTLYLCHRNADPDALGSGYALQKAFGGDLGAVEDLSRAGRSLVSALGADVIMNPPVEGYDLVVIVDASVGLQIGNPPLSRYAVVDHHLDKDLLSGAEFYIQRSATSTAEIVWKILIDSEVKVTEDMARGLLVGTISDTGRFRRASPDALRAAAGMLEAGAGYDQALEILSRVPSGISQRIAVLKAATRAQVDRVGDWLIATTEINAFEGYSAMALVDIGADVAFAAGKHNGTTRVSGRSNREAVRAGLDLSEIMRSVAKEACGEGGGHRAAAALEAEGEPKALLLECKKRSGQRLTGA